ncbi:MAG: hypothetical protein PHU03_03410 [Syntrophales bacterium]|nr:hypothetical protein [Syntrophales bacterium]
MNQDHEKVPQQEQEPFHVDEFRPEDAEGIVRLFHATYGDGYPIRLFYDPQAIIDANREGRYYSIVARTDSGNVIGVGHLFRSAPFESVYEAGVSIVLKDYRNSGANTRILEFLYDTFVPQQSNIEEVFGEAVCNHVFMQKAVAHFEHAETGIEVALMPAEAYAKEKSAMGRVATLNAFRCYVPKPHRIYLPPIYETLLRKIYGNIGYDRDIAIADKILPADKTTRAELSVFDFAGVARIAVHEARDDLPSRISDLENQARERNVVVFQAWLNLTEPWAGRAVDILREGGYFFGGALPRWFDGDGLLMQKLECPPYFDDIQLLSYFSKELLAFIREDWKQVQLFNAKT